MTADRWKYAGTEKRANQKARVWRLFVEPSEGYGTYHGNYTLYVSEASPRARAKLKSNTQFLRCQLLVEGDPLWWGQDALVKTCSCWREGGVLLSPVWD